MIDPHTLQLVARLSIALFAAGTVCTALRFLTAYFEIADEETPDRWRFMSTILNFVGLLLAVLVTLLVSWRPA